MGLRGLVIENDRDIGNIETTGGKVSGEEVSGVTIAEGYERRNTLNRGLA